MEKESFEKAISLRDELDLIEYELKQLETYKIGLLRLTLSRKPKVNSLIEKFFKTIQEEMDREKILINKEFEDL